MNERITSRQNSKIKALAELLSHPSPEGFLIEGFHLVEMALEAGCLIEVLGTVEPPHGQVPFTPIEASVLDKITSSKTPEGVVGLAKLPPSKQWGNRVLLLDRVQDPGNLGTLLRSALSFGYPDVILTPGCASCLKDKAIAASQGAIFHINLHLMKEEEIPAFAKQQGYSLVATALEGATPLGEFALPPRHILALGNEGRGLSSYLLDQASAKVKIEMTGIDSLNVAIAGAILMYTFSRRDAK